MAKHAKKKAKKDYDGDGKVESPSKEYMGSKDKAIKTAKAKKKPKKKTTLKESVDIAKFISAVSQKKYAAANKYLKAVVERKILKRIDNATDKPLF
jgi:hypothetical protein